MEKTVKLYTRPIDQGQTIEISYGYSEDGIHAYRRTTDRSDGSVAWERGELDWDAEPEGVSQDRAPCVVSWEPCEAVPVRVVPEGVAVRQELLFWTDTAIDLLAPLLGELSLSAGERIVRSE